MMYKNTLMLSLAVDNDDLDGVKKNLKLRLNVNKKINGKSILYKAVERSNFDIAQELIKHGAEVNFTCDTGEGCTPLHLAVKNRKGDIVHLLLISGADVHAKTKHGDTPLHFTVSTLFEKAHSSERRRYTEEGKAILISQMLLSKGAEINARNKKLETVLHLSIEYGCVEMLEHLLLYNVDVNAKDIFGDTPLHRTDGSNCEMSDKERKQIAEALLKKGADYQATNANKETILHLAAESGYVEVVKLLLQLNIDVNVKDKNGNTPLHRAVDPCYKVSDKKCKEIAEKKCREIVEFLIYKGVDISAKNACEDTALHLVAEYGFTEVVELLLKYGADVDSMKKNGCMPLHYAAHNGHERVIRLLVDFGAAVNAKDNKGNTPLHDAVQNRKTNAVVALLECGADINVESNMMKTPFQQCSRFNDLIRYLVSHVVKLISLNMYVSENNIQKLKSNQIYTDFRIKCEKELEGIKTKKIYNTNITCYDIFTKEIHTLVKFAGNENLVHLYEYNKFTAEFPIYGVALTNLIGQGIKRRNLVSQCTLLLSALSDNLPNHIYENICIYLSDRDLKNVVSACRYDYRQDYFKPRFVPRERDDEDSYVFQKHAKRMKF